jgi:hypothetical protein
MYNSRLTKIKSRTRIVDYRIIVGSRKVENGLFGNDLKGGASPGGSLRGN